MPILCKPTPADSLTILEIEKVASHFKIAKNGCWEWDTVLSEEAPYGRVRIRGKAYRSHRVIWELINGRIPDELVLDHMCDLRACANPKHLRAVTQNINSKACLRNPTTVNATKTSCPKGHPYSGNNLYVYPNGKRRCKTCRRVQMMEMKKKRAY